MYVKPNRVSCSCCFQYVRGAVISSMGVAKDYFFHHCCCQYQPYLWWLYVIRVTYGYGQLKWRYNHLCYHGLIIMQSVVVQQMLCWEMGI